MPTTIPPARYGLIGGSGTWGARFPEDLHLDGVEIAEIYPDGFDTPYGRSAPFKLLTIAGQPVWRVAMHGMWRKRGQRPYTPWVAAKQVAWVYEQAGVQWALVEGSVGGIQNPDAPGQPLPPWSVVIPTDFMMFFRPEDDNPFVAGRKRSARFRDPFCPILRRALHAAASRQPRFASVHDHGVYVCASWGRFETAQEIRVFAGMGAHVVGHTLAHEAPVMRRLGIRFASLNIVSNHAEGHSQWTGGGADSMAEFYRQCPQAVGPVMVEALRSIIESGVEPPADEDHFLTGLDQFPVEGA